MVEPRVQAMIDDWDLLREGRPRCDTTLAREWGAGTWVRLSAGDDARSSLTLITAPDHAVSILALGTVEETHGLHNRWLEGQVELTRTSHPPVVIELHGQYWNFLSAAGGWLLGYVEVAEEVALLGHDGESILVLLGDGEDFEIRAALRPSEIPRVIVLDAPPKKPSKKLSKKPSKKLSKKPSKKPSKKHQRSDRSPSTEIAVRAEAHHHRILDEPPVRQGDGDGVRLAVVVPVALAELARAAEVRACQLTKADRACIARGVPNIAVFLEVLRMMARNFFATGRAIYRAFREFDGERISMSEHDFVCTLGLLAATGTCLVERPSGKLWIVRGEGIDEVDHPLHLQLCSETRSGAGREAARRHGIEGATVTAVAAAPVARAIAESSEMFGERRGETRPQRRVRGPTLSRDRRRSTSRRRSGAVAGRFPSAGFVLAAIEAVVIDGPRVAPEIFDDVKLALAAERWRNCDDEQSSDDGRRLFAAYWVARLDERARPRREVVVAAEAETIASHSPEIADAQPPDDSIETTTSSIGKLCDTMGAPATNCAVYQGGLREEDSDPAISTTEECDASFEPPAEDHRVDIRVTTPAPTSSGQGAHAGRAEAWLRARGPGLPDLTPPEPGPGGDSPPRGSG